MLIPLLNDVKYDEDIFNKIYSSFNKPTLSYEEIKKYFQILILSLIEYLQSDNNEEIFFNVAKTILRNMEIQIINFENIIKGFNVFITEFLKKNTEDLTINEIKKFTNAVNLLLIHFSIIYNKKLYHFNERILNNISSGIIVLDNNLTILKANKKFYEILGNSYNNISGKNLKEVLEGREGIPVEKLKKNCLLGRGLKETELFVKRDNGQKFHRTIYADTLIDNNGAQQGFIVYVKDTDYLQYLKETFSKYLSKQVAHKILSEKRFNLRGERKEVCLMFVDVRNFTEFSEKNDPEFVLTVLNQYFNLIIDIVFEYGGTLDKFIGDAVMVIFGAPVEYHDSVDRCIDCAIKIQKMVKNFNMNVEPKFQLGIGINYGEVIVGNIGSEEKRVEYTAIGDAVNTSDRVQRITPGEKIYITENVLNALRAREKYRINFIKNAKFKGKSREVKIFEVIV